MAAFSRRKLAQYVVAQLEAGANVRGLAKQVAAHLVASKQLKQVDLLVQDIEQIAVEQYGYVPVRITAARPLDEAAEKRITDFVRALTNAKQATVTAKLVDSSLIGGVIIETPDSVLDASLLTKLNKLTTMKV